MKVVKCPHNSNHIRILNYQIEPTQAYKLRTVGIASNCNAQGHLFVMIDCGRSVVDADIAKVKQIIG